jgi:hypothetical protein
MIQDPQVETYSRHARICLVIAAFGAVLFIAALLMGVR